MVNKILWVIYILLLGVLLPHTAWAFEQFEPTGGTWTAYAAAFAFEAAIAALTHKLSRHIEQGPKKGKWLAKFSYRYLNAYSVGLVVSLGISALANLAHAVQFGGSMKIFTDWGIPFGVYAFAFGAILPMISLTFARVLSNVVESETDEDPVILSLQQQNSEMRNSLKSETTRRMAAEARFEALGDVFVKMASNDKRERILAVYRKWPQLTGAAIALLTESSAPYVSEVLKEQAEV